MTSAIPLRCSENSFCVKADVHEMAINRKVLYKQYSSTEKILKSPNIFCLFLKTSLNALTIRVTIMCIWFCPVQIFAIN